MNYFLRLVFNSFSILSHSTSVLLRSSTFRSLSAFVVRIKSSSSLISLLAFHFVLRRIVIICNTSISFAGWIDKVWIGLYLYWEVTDFVLLGTTIRSLSFGRVTELVLFGTIRTLVRNQGFVVVIVAEHRNAFTRLVFFIATCEWREGLNSTLLIFFLFEYT
jgi:hypothetical protein